MKKIILIVILFIIGSTVKAQDRIVIDNMANHMIIDDQQQPLDSLSLDYFKEQTGDGELLRVVIDVKENKVVREWLRNGVAGILTEQVGIDSDTRVYLDSKFKAVQ